MHRHHSEKQVAPLVEKARLKVCLHIVFLVHYFERLKMGSMHSCRNWKSYAEKMYWYSRKFFLFLVYKLHQVIIRLPVCSIESKTKMITVHQQVIKYSFLIVIQHGAILIDFLQKVRKINFTKKIYIWGGVWSQNITLIRRVTEYSRKLASFPYHTNLKISGKKTVSFRAKN